MKINYPKILKKNMVNVFKDVISEVEKNVLKDGHHLYITFQTKDNIDLPDWLKKKFPEEMTIVIQHEYWNLKVLEEKFNISLSFNNIKVNLSIPYNSIISFADPYANFGLKIDNIDRNRILKEKNNMNKKITEDYKNENVIDFSKFKKLN